MEQKNLKMKKFQLIHYVIVVLLAIQLILRIYKFATSYSVNTNTINIGLFIGIILVASILYNITKKQAIGYMFLSVWFGVIIIRLPEKIDELNNFFHYYNFISFIIIFIFSFVVWWKIYGFEPFNKMSKK